MYADLREASLSRASLREANLGDAKLQGAKLIEYAYDEDRLVLTGGLSTHRHVFKSELKSG
jgi:uncharacterized protein YjbI with pentapeptide repeats